MSLYNHVIMNQWDRFDEIELVALMDANALWVKLQTPEFDMLQKIHPIQNPLDPRLQKDLDLDLPHPAHTRMPTTPDIDLHVIEPSSGKKPPTTTTAPSPAAQVSKDFTQGYGPEEYLIHHAPPGTYQINANYFGSTQQTLQGSVTIQATLITNFGRPNEKRQSLTLRLTDKKETIPLGQITIAPGNP